MLSDKNMHTALINTLIMMLVTIVFQVGIAIILAIMVDNIGRGSKFFRTVYFFPIVISATALGLLFNLIFLYNIVYIFLQKYIIKGMTAGAVKG